MTFKLNISDEQIAEFCRRWGIVKLALFGSALRDDFRADSDLDFLVSFSDEAHPSLFDMVRMQDELQTILGRPVDLVSRRAIETSRNYLRRRAILESAEVVYGS